MKPYIILALLLTGLCTAAGAQTPLSPERSSYQADSNRFEAQNMRFKGPLEFTRMFTNRWLHAQPVLVNPGYRFSAGNSRFAELTFHMLEQGKVELDHVTCDKDVFFQGVTGIELRFTDSHFYREIYTPNAFIRKLVLYQDTVADLGIERCLLDNAFMSNCYFPDRAVLSGVIRDTLQLINNRFGKGARLDLTQLRGDSLGTRKIPIILTSQDIGQVDLDYRHFHLIFEESAPRDSCLQVYRRLIESFQGKHQDTSVKILEREMRYFRGNATWWEKTVNFLTDQKEDYGEDLWIMLKFTALVLLVFTLFNLLGYRKLNNEVYKIENFEPGLPWRKPRKYFWYFYYSLVYTAILFINPLLKLENLKYKKPQLLLWVLFIYFTGLVLLYYILHYLLKLP